MKGIYLPSGRFYSTSTRLISPATSSRWVDGDELAPRKIAEALSRSFTTASGVTPTTSFDKCTTSPTSSTTRSILLISTSIFEKKRCCTGRRRETTTVFININRDDCCRQFSSTTSRRKNNFQAIDHVAMGVEDLDRAVCWYREMLDFTLFRPRDPMFHEEKVIRMIAHRQNPSMKIALLQLPEDIVEMKKQQIMLISSIPSPEASASSSRPCQGHDRLLRLLTDRTFRGHFSLSVSTRSEFQEFCDSLSENLRRCGGVTEDELWTENQDYGVQKSIFFHDLDLNELEVSYWLAEHEIAIAQNK
ncbi:unnamed protein product [Amoebophrya sp. A25]|nr:unnamed protein product [Amoebophrya sp. A25]|eukprot:GSA25T00025133001.1